MQKTQLWPLMGLIITLVLAVGCGGSVYDFKGSYVDPPLVLPNVTLTANNGQPFQLNEDLEADIALVFFGYTYCPDICPLTLADVRQALDGLNPADRQRVQVIFISGDPERDTPEALTRYLGAFDPSFIGLTGDMTDIQSVMQPLGAYAEKDTETSTDSGYFVSHTARVYLVKSNGQVPVMHGFGFTPEDLHSDLVHLLSEAS